MRQSLLVGAITTLLATSASAAIVDNSTLAKQVVEKPQLVAHSCHRTYRTGLGSRSTGGAVRHQSFIGSGGRTAESGWRSASRYSRRLSPKESGAVGNTGTGK